MKVIQTVTDDIRLLGEKTGQRIQHLLEMAGGNDDATRLVVQVAADLAKLTVQFKQMERIARGATAGMSEATRQRDMALDELADLLKALKERNPLGENKFVAGVVRDIHQEAVDNYYQAFWESLPYDLAEVLGDEWTQYSADKLYNLLMMNLSEEDPADYRWTEGQLVEFRRRLKALVDEVSDGGDE